MSIRVPDSLFAASTRLATIDCVPDRRQPLVAGRTDRSDYSVAEMEADADIEVDAVHGGEEGLHAVDGGESLKRGVHGADRRVGLTLDAEDRHQAVADELVDVAVVALDDLACLREITVQEVHHVVRRERLGEGREA